MALWEVRHVRREGRVQRGRCGRVAHAGALKRLKLLTLHENALVRLPQAVRELADLTTLTLHRNGAPIPSLVFGGLPEEVGHALIGDSRGPSAQH